MLEVVEPVQAGAAVSDFAEATRDGVGAHADHAREARDRCIDLEQESLGRVIGWAAVMVVLPLAKVPRMSVVLRAFSTAEAVPVTWMKVSGDEGGLETEGGELCLDAPQLGSAGTVACGELVGAEPFLVGAGARVVERLEVLLELVRCWSGT